MCYVVGRSILDVGCGPGRFLGDLLDRGYAAYGLDRSPAMLRRAQRSLRAQGRPGRIIGGEVRNLPFADASFDCLVLTFPTPFVRDPTFWDEAARVLRPDGKIVVVEGATSNTLLWPGLLERVWGLRPRPLESAVSPYPADSPRNQASPWRERYQASVTTREGTVWLVIAHRKGQENSALTDSLE